MYRGPVLCFRVSDDHNSTQMALTPIGSPCPTAAPGRDEVTMYNDCEEHLSGTRAHMKQTFSIKVFQKWRRSVEWQHYVTSRDIMSLLIAIGPMAMWWRFLFYFLFVHMQTQFQWLMRWGWWDGTWGKALAPNLTTQVLSPEPTQQKEGTNSSDHHTSMYTTPQYVYHGMCMCMHICIDTHTHTLWGHK